MLYIYIFIPFDCRNTTCYSAVLLFLKDYKTLQPGKFSLKFCEQFELPIEEMHL